MPVEIPVSGGYVALVDEEDAPRITPWKWRALKQYSSEGALVRVYAMGEVGHGIHGRRKVLMHRYIMGEPDGQVDHIDGHQQLSAKILNNCRSNLRVGTRAQNQANARKPKGFTSDYKGVSWCPRTRKWHARIQPGDKLVYLGSYFSEHEAAAAYNRAAKEHYGEFARLNEIPPDSAFPLFSE